MKKNMTKQRGITLIALVITIIVLIMLAGVTIAALSGDNGILQKAGKAKEETEQAEKDEKTKLDSYNNYIDQYTNGGFIESKGVNAPVLKDKMTLVKYDEQSKEWIVDTTNSEYSYIAESGTSNSNSSHWANAKVTIDGIESFFVWIPRFAYKIDTADEKIDVKFIRGTGTIAADGTACKYADDSTLNPDVDYIIHPAFTTNANCGGGWNAELSGLWI